MKEARLMSVPTLANEGDHDASVIGIGLRRCILSCDFVLVTHGLLANARYQ